MPPFNEILKSKRGQIGLATISVQVASFALLYFTKVKYTNAEFAFYLTQLAFAGIVGSIATMRFELLIYQKFGRMSLAAALMPFAIALLITALTIPSVKLFQIAGLNIPSITPAALFLILGIGINTAFDFLFVQVKQTGLLLMSRLCQAIGLACLAAALFWSPTFLSIDDLLLLQGSIMTMPAMIWMWIYLHKYLPHHYRRPITIMPERDLWKRSAYLTSSTGVNSIYINIPILLAAATQSASFTADLGLVLRFLTGPVTFIRQIYGQIYIARGIEYQHKKGSSQETLINMTYSTLRRSAITYILLTIPILIFIIFTKEYANINDIYILPYIYIVVLMQSMVNPVSQIRAVINQEGNFLIFDIARTSILTISLSYFIIYFRYELVLSIISCILYIIYIAIIINRVNKYDYMMR